MVYEVKIKCITLLRIKGVQKFKSLVWVKQVLKWQIKDGFDVKRNEPSKFCIDIVFKIFMHENFFYKQDSRKAFKNSELWNRMTREP